MIMLNLKKRSSTVLKEMVTLKTHEVESLSAAILDFVKDFSFDQKPTVGVIGIAGSVQNN